MPTELSPSDKKQFLSDVGQDLVAHHGKKKYYKKEEVRASCRRRKYPEDWDCHAFCLFLDEATFQAIHVGVDAVCNYQEMRRDALAALTDSGSFLDIDLDLSWLEWPDIDLGSVFDWFDAS